MFRLKNKPKLQVRVKGIGNYIYNIFSPIPYEVRILDGNWSSYFGHYQNQKWGVWDSDSCWCLSSINCAEDQLEWLWKNNMFSAEAKNFFTSNGYIDTDGDFSLSERFHEILCGNRDEGGTAEEAWQSFKSRGFIPRSWLTYTEQQANSFKTKQDFDNDYFNVNAVTQRMKDVGVQSLNYITIAYQKIGSMWTTPDRSILQAALKQSPLNYGIPVPYDLNGNCLWNTPDVKYNGSRVLQHEVEGYYLPDGGDYYIFDQYLPNLKKLSTDYYIPSVTQGIITAVKPVSVTTVPQPQGYMNDTFWQAVMGWFNNIFYPGIQIG